MARPSASATWATKICPAKKSGWWGSADTPIKTLAGAFKARWICEQAHQQLKEELGLDHFEGRSWTGLHRNALMTMIA